MLVRIHDPNALESPCRRRARHRERAAHVLIIFLLGGGVYYWIWTLFRVCRAIARNLAG